MKIGSKELLDKVKQPKQLELFSHQLTPIEKFYMDYVLQISEQINKNMQMHMDMIMLQPVHSKTLHPIEYGSNVKDLIKSWGQYKPEWNENRYDSITGISAQEYYNNVRTEYAADPTV